MITRAPPPAFAALALPPRLNLLPYRIGITVIFHPPPLCITDARSMVDIRIPAT